MSKIKTAALSLALLASACFCSGQARAQSVDNANIDVNKAINHFVGALNTCVRQWANVHTPVLGNPVLDDNTYGDFWDSDFVLCGGDGTDQDPILDMTDAPGDPQVTDPASPEAGSRARPGP